MTLGSGEQLLDALEVLVECVRHLQSEIPRHGAALGRADALCLGEGCLAAAMVGAALIELLFRLFREVQRGQAFSVCDDRVGSYLEQVFYDQEVSVKGGDMQRCIFKVLCLLVHILALSDDNADHVELTISAGLPDVCKMRLKNTYA